MELDDDGFLERVNKLENTKEFDKIDNIVKCDEYFISVNEFEFEKWSEFEKYKECVINKILNE